MPICRLCLKDKPLLKKSHIIPDFMYQELYDENHKLISLNPKDYATGKGYIKNPSSGEYEGGILCGTCDNEIIGAYESYASKTLFGGQEKNNASTEQTFEDGSTFSLCENIDYQNFKLFLLSILWRASISKRPTFAYINLGPHEEIIRKMVYEGNSGNLYEYPVFMMTYLNDSKMPSDIIITPTKRRTRDGYTFYIFPIGGFLYNFYIGSKQHPLPDFVKASTISPQNKLNIIHVPKGEGWNFLFRYMGLIRNK